MGIPFCMTVAQIHPESGRMFHQNFMPSDYDAHAQNWAILEDENGLIYVGNGNGVLEFDGVEWNVIEVTGGLVVRSLALGTDNRIFAGSVNDFGEIVADSLGRSVYRSLAEDIPADLQDFEDVWEIQTTRNGVFFRTRTAIFHVDRQDSLHIYKPENRFERLHKVDDILYSVDLDIGLKKLEGDNFIQVEEGDLFVGKAIWYMNRQPDGSILILTRDGTYLYDGYTFQSFEADITPILGEMSVYNVTEIEGVGYAIATILGGVYISDYPGNILRKFGADKLPTTQVSNVMADRLNNLWITTTNGISRIELSNPLTYFDSALNIPAGVEGVVRHDGTLFVSTSAAVYYLDNSATTSTLSQFVVIPSTTNSHRRFLSTEHGLLLTSNTGLVQVHRNGSRIVIPDYEALNISRSAFDPDLFLLSHIDGVVLFRYENGNWVVEKELEGVTEQVFSVVQGKDGIIWIGTEFQGLIRVDPGTDESDMQIDRYDPQEHFGSRMIKVALIEGEPVLLTGTGIYKPSDSRNQDSPFTPLYSEIQESVDDPISFSRLVQGFDGRYWAYTNRGNGFITNLNNPAETFTTAALGRIPASSTQSIFPETDGTVWIGDQNGLFRYNSQSDYPAGIPFEAFVRSVLNAEDQLFGGNTAGAFAPLTLTFRLNDLRFRFGTNFFDDVSSIQFQTRLSGFDENWSAWSSETYRSYTNLPHGDFTMQVRAMNTYGEISNAGEFAFTILPPWWRTWWAYTLYLILFAGFLFGVDRNRLRSLRKREAELEAIVNERTEELQEEKKITEAQAEKLKQLDVEKSRFFANISHEFRTPLTLTIAPLENLHKERYGVLTEDGKAQVEMATRNAKRLMRLVTQLLDLARFEANLFKLKPETAELNQYLTYLTSRFVGAAERYVISFDVSIPDERIIASFDPEQFEKVISNLLSNAFKFTPEGGTVSFTLESKDSHAVITIKDNGQGISSEHLPRLFDRFYQAEKSEMQPGTGIGLALVKEITEQHSGKIEVESTPGEGSVFVVRIPLADATEAEVVDLQMKEGDESLEEVLLPDKVTTVDDEQDIADEDDERKILLVVDDNRDIRTYLRDHFSEEYRVIEAASGNRALEKIRNIPPDVIISDIMMPDGDGFTLLKNLRNNPETDFLPIILLTARAEAEDKLEGLGIGADDYLTKPFSMEEVTLRIHNLIERQKRLQKYYERKGGHLTGGKKSIHPDRIEAPSSDDLYLEQIRRIIQENMQNEEFSVEDLADSMFQSRTQLFRRLKELTGETPSSLIKRMRLERGAELLKQKAGTVSEVAYSTGFRSVAQFSKSFRDQYSKTPTEYSAAA